MPRMQVYLPDDLYEQVKTRQLPASELLQDAVRAEVRRQDLLGETDAYLAGLLAELGECFTGEGSRDAAQHRFLRTCDVAETVPFPLARRAAWLRTKAREGSAVD